MIECKGGVGWVLQDHMGAFVTLIGRVVEGAIDVLFAEVSAIMVGLNIVISYVNMSLVVESNNLTAVHLLNGEDDVLTLVKSIVEEIISSGKHCPT